MQPYRCSKKRSAFLRPQTALGTSRHSEQDTDSTNTNRNATPDPTRPWTANTRERGEVNSDKRVMRQRKQKSHSKAKERHKEAKGAKTLQVLRSESPARAPVLSRSNSGSELEVVTMVGAVPGKPSFSRTSRGPVRKPNPEAFINEKEEGEVRRSGPLKRHPSFEAWVVGSPHDSDEYDTDLEEKEIQLAAVPKQTILRQQDGTGVQVYDDVCRELGFVPISYIRRHLGKRNLRMRHHYLGGKAARPLAAAFKFNTITESLDLSDNYLESNGAASLAEMMKNNTFITTLNLSNNFIESHGVAAIAEMLDSNTTLKALSLGGNRLMERDAHCFVEPLKNNLSLMFLDLSNNEFGEIGGIHLGAALGANDAITEMDLSWNGIRMQGAVAIANAMKVNTFIEVLDLGWNGFGEEGTVVLAQALQVNLHLKVLDLTNNRIDTNSAKKLANGLKKNRGLETLILNLNPLGDQGVEAILNAADVHPCLKFLSVEELGINPENLQHIKQLEDEKGLIILYGGSGGYQRNSSLHSVLKLLTRFTGEHRVDMKTAFLAQDKDHSGILTAEEVKMGLRSAGLRLTGKQLDLLLDEIDYSHSGNIKYGQIVSGEIFLDYHKRRPSRGFALTDEVTVVDMDSDDEP